MLSDEHVVPDVEPAHGFDAFGSQSSGPDEQLVWQVAPSSLPEPPLVDTQQTFEPQSDLLSHVMYEPGQLLLIAAHDADEFDGSQQAMLVVQNELPHLMPGSWYEQATLTLVTFDVVTVPVAPVSMQVRVGGFVATVTLNGVPLRSGVANVNGPSVVSGRLSARLFCSVKVPVPVMPEIMPPTENDSVVHVTLMFCTLPFAVLMPFATTQFCFAGG